MKLSVRKSLWWILPVVVALTVTALVAPVFVRQVTQRRVAKQIVEMGCSVRTRFNGPMWLFHFASESA